LVEIDMAADSILLFHHLSRKEEGL